MSRAILLLFYVIAVGFTKLASGKMICPISSQSMDPELDVGSDCDCCEVIVNYDEGKVDSRVYSCLHLGEGEKCESVKTEKDHDKLRCNSTSFCAFNLRQQQSQPKALGKVACPKSRQDMDPTLDIFNDCDCCEVIVNYAEGKVDSRVYSCLQLEEGEKCKSDKTQKDQDKLRCDSTSFCSFNLGQQQSQPKALGNHALTCPMSTLVDQETYTSLVNYCDCCEVQNVYENATSKTPTDQQYTCTLSYNLGPEGCKSIARKGTVEKKRCETGSLCSLNSSATSNVQIFPALLLLLTALTLV